jgi:hypothetical protein
MTPPRTVADVLTDKPHHARQEVAGEPGVLLNHPLLHQLSGSCSSLGQRLATTLRYPATRDPAHSKKATSYHILSPPPRRVHSLGPLHRLGTWLSDNAWTACSNQDAVRSFGRAADVYRFESYTIMVWRKNLLPDLGPAVY